VWCVVGLPVCMLLLQTVTPDAGPPGAPTDVESYVGPNSDTVAITWQAPVTDGGSPVTQYCVVEQQDQVPPMCQPSADEMLDSVAGLPYGGHYVFGVLAGNECVSVLEGPACPTMAPCLAHSFFLMHTPHSISFTRAQGIPK
jgi:hypothetical protein